MKYYIIILCLLVSACDNKKQEPKKDTVTADDNSFSSFVNTAKNIQNTTPAKPGYLSPLNNNIVLESTDPLRKVTEDISITNTGETEININNVEFATNADQFTVTGTCMEGHPILPNTTCNIFITHFPKEPKDHDTKIIITHTGENNPVLLDIKAPVNNSSSGENNVDINELRKKPLKQEYSDFMKNWQYPIPVTEGSYKLKRNRIVPANRYISAVMESTVLTEIGGRLIAVTDRPVYAVEGSNILIPQGSRLIGTYQALSSASQTRLAIIWERVDTPDNHVIILNDVTSADAMGRNGVPGSIDYRFFEKYSISLATSMINMAGILAADNTQVSVSSDGTSTQTKTSEQQAIDRFSEDLSDIAKDYLQQRSNITPVITIPAGTLITINLNNDVFVPEEDYSIAYIPNYESKAIKANIKEAESAEKKEKTKTEDGESVNSFYGKK